MTAALDGQYWVRHAVLTVGGTWSLPGTQYPSWVAAGVADLCEEIPVPYPAAFGPIGGAANAPSYQQSVTQAEVWIANWLATNPLRTFALGGYSQGGEATSQIAIRIMGGDLAKHASQFIGGYTFGSPCRPDGAHAPTITDPGGHGIASTLMPALPTIGGQVVWADYVHSKANGDAANDMYTRVPDGQAGKDMTDVYAAATNVQLNNIVALAKTIAQTLTATVNDLGLIPSTKIATGSPTKAITGALGGLLTGAAGGPAGAITGALTGAVGGAGLNPAALVTELLGLGMGAIEGLFTEILSGPKATDTGTAAAVEAALEGLKFLAAPGGPTAPHISYGGEIAGYRNLVPEATDFLRRIATLTTARAAA